MARKPFRIALIVVASTMALALAIAGFFAYRVYTTGHPPRRPARRSRSRSSAA
jgi:hypothetical protein